MASGGYEVVECVDGARQKYPEDYVEIQEEDFFNRHKQRVADVLARKEHRYENQKDDRRNEVGELFEHSVLGKYLGFALELLDFEVCGKSPHESSGGVCYGVCGDYDGTYKYRRGRGIVLYPQDALLGDQFGNNLLHGFMF